VRGWRRTNSTALQAPAFVNLALFESVEVVVEYNSDEKEMFNHSEQFQEQFLPVETANLRNSNIFEVHCKSQDDIKISIQVFLWTPSSLTILDLEAIIFIAIAFAAMIQKNHLNQIQNIFHEQIPK
jgi:hypothetical protein